MTTLRDLRTSRQLTLAQAAGAADISVSNWSEIETGKVFNPGIRTCRAMAEALGVSLDTLGEAIVSTCRK